ncbi:hypothetical protein BCR34DRAFT_663373 [Clohesyomyces aquaticus]|uniref:Uncharacterized protein n=1 Tax=Clohesyomyces aquaticus TaxID=1231657 RepID=A0A1Y1ZSA9_9PLEO|nr:hypothetical protein BCR34DRAFT_663373 [Clohesyomyces aquaticus]
MVHSKMPAFKRPSGPRAFIGDYLLACDTSELCYEYNKEHFERLRIANSVAKGFQATITPKSPSNVMDAQSSQYSLTSSLPQRYPSAPAPISPGTHAKRDNSRRNSGVTTRQKRTTDPRILNMVRCVPPDVPESRTAKDGPLQDWREKSTRAPTLGTVPVKGSNGISNPVEAISKPIAPLPEYTNYHPQGSYFETSRPEALYRPSEPVRPVAPSGNTPLSTYLVSKLSTTYHFTP